MLHGTASLQIWNMLYVPEANKWLFSLISTRQCGSVSQTMKEGTIVSHNGTPFIIGTPKSGKLHFFDMVLVKNWNEVPRAFIAMLSDYTLWHRRMEHTHQCIIKHLRKNMEGGPYQITEVPLGACEGCKKGKSKRLPSQLWNPGQRDPWILFILIWMKCQFSPLVDTSILPPT